MSLLHDFKRQIVKYILESNEQDEFTLVLLWFDPYQSLINRRNLLQAHYLNDLIHPRVTLTRRVYSWYLSERNGLILPN